MTNVTDASILSDLEYRGMQSFLIDMECGFKVPTSMVARIRRIVLAAYGVDLVSKAVTKEAQTGTYCLVKYQSTMTTLKSLPL